MKSSIEAAGNVVTKSVTAFVTAGGNPSKLISDMKCVKSSE